MLTDRTGNISQSNLPQGRIGFVDPEMVDGIDSLSRRELTIAAKYSEGMTYRKIAQLLHIAPSTVRTHLTTIYRKLGISNKLMLLQVFSGDVQSRKSEGRCLERGLPAGADGQRAVRVAYGDGRFADDNTLINHISHVLSERRELCDHLAASEARYRALVTSMDRFVARMTPDGRLSFVNGAYCKYFGKDRDELLGNSFNEFTLTIPEDRDRDIAHLSSLTPEHPSAVIELRRRLPDGSMRYVEWTDTALFDTSGRLVELQLFGHDVTERVGHLCNATSTVGIPQRRC